MRLGLCCTFNKQTIRFRTATAKSLGKLGAKERAEALRALAGHNASALHAAIEYCATHAIGSFRVNSQILPLRTHARLGYDADFLGEEIIMAFRSCGDIARQTDTRISFHPDQFVVLNSPKAAVVASSLAELEYQAEVAEWIGADVINIHGGGGYGEKPTALGRLIDCIGRLSNRVRTRLTIENDDRTYAPRDLLPLCERFGIPLVYDVHHHRSNADDLDVETATNLALETWDREPLFHISSPRGGWHAKNPRSHSDYIDLRDFPRCWDDMNITVEVEAKAKELAVLKLAKDLKRRRTRNTAQK